MTDDVIYLDHAAATPLEPAVLAAMRPYFSERFYNPSAGYLAARQVAADLQAARQSIAYWLGCRGSELVFTAGGTEANNLAIHGLMERYPQGNVVISAIEHDSVLAPARRYDCREVAVNGDGIIDLAALAAAIDEHTVLVSVMHANNEIGTIEPLKDVAAVIDRYRQQRQETANRLPLYFHSDACQAGNYLDLHVSRLGVDMLTLNGGKLYGPKQSGALYVSSRVKLASQILGGGQERNLRSGTENVAQSIGLARALTLAQDQRHAETRRLQRLQALFIERLAAELPQATINGSRKKRLPNNVHITIPGQDNERLLMQLDEQGILAAAGSACSASNEEPSHVLRAIGLDDRQAQASLRLTMGRATTETAVQRAVAELAGAVKA